MKKLGLVLMCVLSSVSLVMAAGVEVGGHAAYTFGGDIESESLGYGGQVRFIASDNVSLEVAGTLFSDDTSGGAVEIDNIVSSASLMLSAKTSTGVFLYIGGGASLLMIDADEMTMIDGSIYSLDMDDSLGYHGCAGINIPLSEAFGMFIEYRQFFFEVEGEATFTLNGATTDTTAIDDDYGFGMAKAGLNVIF